MIGPERTLLGFDHHGGFHHPVNQWLDGTTIIYKRLFQRHDGFIRPVHFFFFGNGINIWFQN
jgi:hypothetical protein